MELALMIEGQEGLTWARWQRLADAAEALGFAGLYRSDHFVVPTGEQVAAIEMFASMTWLASHTNRIEFGPMVSPVSFRNPVVTAWTAAAIDDLSAGRFQLGLGAGWQEREHRSFGFDLLDTDARFQRFEEGIQVVQTLLRSEQESSFEGDYYHLERALLMPRPSRPGGPPLVIGGNGPKRTLPLAATFAGEWNGVYTSPSEYRNLNARLDGLLGDRGRAASSVKRSIMTRGRIGRDDTELARYVDGDVAALRASGELVGTASQIVEGIGAFEDAGAKRIMFQWLELDDIDGIEEVAKSVLPQIGGQLIS